MRGAALLASGGLLVLLVARAGVAGSATAPLFLAPTGSDAGRCDRSSPCLTFARAFALARPGQTVRIAPGRYGGQQEVRPVSREGDAVVFEPAVPGTVVLESLDVYGQRVEFRGLRIERDFYVKCGAADVVLRGSRAAFLFVRTSARVSLISSSFGPSTNVSSAIGPGAGCEAPPRRVLLDRVTMHDYASQPFNGVHMECLAVDGVVGLTIRNSRFTRCEDFDTLFKPEASVATMRNVVLENNWFDRPAPDGDHPIRFSAPESGATYADLLIRNNSFNGTVSLSGRSEGIAYVNARMVANVGGRSPCVDDVLFAYNVWGSGRPCGRHDRVARAGFRDAQNFDLHLVPGAPAVDNGDPGSFPARDIDGQRRPAGRRPDAGADELVR